MTHGPLLETDAEPIPGYRLLSRLGRGGYGEVWKASAPGGMHKAIKFVFGDMEGFGDEGKGAEQEYKSLHRVKSIRHPFILSLERIDIIDGRLMIVTELADRNLLDRFNESLLEGRPGIPREELLAYMLEAAEALDLMNRQYQIQHLDIKPQNLFLVYNHIKVADFGLAKDLDGAKAVVTGGVTPTYAPPETFEGWVSPQSDQYSLAIVYQEMLTGTRPFVGSNTRNLIMQHLTGTPDLSSLPERDREAVNRALAKVPGERFASCGDFVRALRDGTHRPATKLVTAPTMLADSVVQQPVETPVRALLTPRSGTNTPGLPALVTVREARGASVAMSTLRPKAADTAVHAVSRCLPTEKSSDGVLFPTLLVGIGATGLAVLKQLRRLILEQHGYNTLPNLRWLFIDTDPATIEHARNDAEGLQFNAEEVYHAGLRRPAHYLTRDHLADLETWLASDMLYKLPRTPVVNGVRAFGRLALFDHYHPIRQRLRSALEQLSRPEHLQHALQLTHLGLRSNHPRAYMVASLGGGTGSGMAIDLAYVLRNELATFGVSTHHLMGLFGLPTEAKNALEERAMSNTRAALVELNHFEQPNHTYESLFDKRERKLVDGDRPFRRTAFFAEEHPSRGVVASLGIDSAAHILYTDTLTPLGRLASPDLGNVPEHPHSLMGIRRVIWPYKDLIHAASRSLARRVVKQWLETTNIQRDHTPTACIIQEWNDLGLSYEGLTAQMQTVAAEQWGTTIDERRDQLLLPLQPNNGNELPNAAEAEEVLEQLVDLYGRVCSAHKDAGGQINAAIAPWIRLFTSRVNGRFAEFIRTLYEQPGFRYVGAYEAVQWLSQRLNELIAWAEGEVAGLNRAADRETELLKTVFGSLPPPGASRLARKFSAASELYTRLNAWCAQRLRILCVKTAIAIYHTLRAQIPEYLCELKGYRDKLRSVHEALSEQTKTIYAEENTVTQPIFPAGAKNLYEATQAILGALTPEEMFEFDSRLQHHLGNDHRTLATLCSRPTDQGRELRELLIDQSEQFLADRIPILTASQALVKYAQPGKSLEQNLESAINAARPPQFSPTVKTMANVILVGVQEDDTGTKVRDGLQAGATIGAFSATPIVDEVIIYRESRGLSLPSLPQFTSSAQADPANDSMQGHTRLDLKWHLPQ